MKFQRKRGEHFLSNSIGHKLRTLRKGRKLTQEQAADMLNITRASVSNYETGRRVPHVSELRRICEAYGVGLDYLGITPTDEVFDLLSRAREVFNNPAVSKDKKDDIYKELMKLYLSI
jgi:transcriptional regulator with XRE-family HTH domain